MSNHSLDRVEIKSATTRVTFAPHLGGRIISYEKRDELGEWSEFVWFEPSAAQGASQNTWCHGGVPVLFPFSGRVYHEGELGSYEFLNHKCTNMPIHGFVHQCAWQVHEHSETSISFSLDCLEEFKDVFPWDYSLVLTWTLKDEKLEGEFYIKNNACLIPQKPHMPMPISAGLHPYFKVGSHHNFSLSLKDFSAYEVSTQGLLGEQVLNPPQEVNVLDHKTFQNTILLPSGQFSGSLLCRLAEKTIEFSVPQQTVFVLWSNDIKNFFCLEPWMDIPNAIHDSGVKVLAVGGSMHWRFSMQVIN